MSEPERTSERHMTAARAALAQYRGRLGARAPCLLEAAARLDDPDRPRRQAELVEQFTRDTGAGRDDAEDIYRVAREEGLEPAFAFELVRCGVAVRGPDDAVPTEIKGDTALAQGSVPEWVAGPPSDEEEARRERRLRTSFRRLRRLLTEHPEPEDALVAFLEEPDVHADGY